MSASTDELFGHAELSQPGLCMLSITNQLARSRFDCSTATATMIIAILSAAGPSAGTAGCSTDRVEPSTQSALRTPALVHAMEALRALGPLGSCQRMVARCLPDVEPLLSHEVRLMAASCG